MSSIREATGELARGFRPVAWVAAVGVAALGTYLIALSAATERHAVYQLDVAIVKTDAEIQVLQARLRAQISGQALPTSPSRVRIRCILELDRRGAIDTIDVSTRNLPTTSRAGIAVVLPIRLQSRIEQQPGIVGVFRTESFDALVVRSSEEFRGRLKVSRVDDSGQYGIEVTRRAGTVRLRPSEEFRAAAASEEFLSLSALYTCGRTFVRIPAGFKVVDDESTIEVLQPMIRELSMSRGSGGTLELALPNNGFGDFLRGGGLNIVTVLIGAIATILGAGLSPTTFRNMVMGSSTFTVVYMGSGIYAAAAGQFSPSDIITNLVVGMIGLAVVWIPYRRLYRGIRNPVSRQRDSSTVR